MSSRKSLFLTQVLPYPLDAGPKVRAYHTLEHLAARHAVTLVSFIRANDPPETLAHLEGLCEHVVTVPMPRSRRRELLALARSLLTGEPFLIARDRSAEMERIIRQLLASSHQPPATSFQSVHADQLWMAPYALLAREEAEKHSVRPRLVLDQHNAVYKVPERMANSARNPVARAFLRREATLMARYEANVCGQFDHVVWVTEEDRAAVEKIAHRRVRGARGENQRAFCGLSDLRDKSSVVPICIDPSAIEPADKLTGKRGILFMGGMHWPPNADGAAWFAREVLPRVMARVPGARFYAVGKNPPSILRSMDGAAAAPGYVDDPEEYWAGSRVFVVPLRAGGGMRVKILDAWARGLPVISTTIGAEGIAYREGEDVLIADTPEALAEAVIRVLLDDELALRLSRAGRRTVEECYDWRRVYQLWDEVCAGD